MPAADPLTHPDVFAARHLGPGPGDVRAMLETVGYASLDALIDAVVPADIRLRHPLDLPPARTEQEALAELRRLAAQNQVFRSYIGMGYHDCITPPVILRNVLENPGWYTAYTPYQAEIAQGRLEALLTFQTMVSDLTGLEIANASLLDEGTAAAEAMHLTDAVAAHDGPRVYAIDHNCHPQTIAVVHTRAEARGVEVVVADPATFKFGGGVIGALLQYPATDGAIPDYRSLCEAAHAAGALVTVATDLLALTLLAPPGEWGADVAVGNSQRFGVPLGYGGPHAAFFATRDQYKRHLPGRIIGVSRDKAGRPGLRMALQTREQHIRRDKATSNVCTAQVLLAVVAAMYAVYHGPAGLRRIAERAHAHTTILADALQRLGYRLAYAAFFDTLAVEVDAAVQPKILDAARTHGINLRSLSATRIGVALDETTAVADVADVVEAFALGKPLAFKVETLAKTPKRAIPKALARTSLFCTHPVFNTHHSETAMLRYLKKLAHLGDDPARLLHHEAQRHGRDDPGDLAPVRPPAPVRAAGANPGVRRAVSPARGVAGRDHRIRKGVAPAQRRLSRRVRRPAGDSRLPPRPRPGPPDHVPDSSVRARHQPRQRGDGRDAGGGGEDR